MGALKLAVTPQKLQRRNKSVFVWMEHKKLRQASCCFDVIANIAAEKVLEPIQHAFVMGRIHV